MSTMLESSFQCKWNTDQGEMGKIQVGGTRLEIKFLEFLGNGTGY